MRYLAFADLHLSDNPPAIRRKEPDWYQAQQNVLDQILREASYFRPDFMLIAGDLFHTSVVSPYLESVVLRWLSAIQLCIPKMRILFTPGQHDLPGNNLEHLNKSSIEVLLSGENMDFLKSGILFPIGKGHALISIPYGESLSEPVEDMRERQPELKSVVVITHRLLYKGKPPYPGAPAKGNLKRAAQEFVGADVVISGDNHQAFDHKEGKTLFINCGRCQTRTITESNYPPPSIVGIDVPDTGHIHYKRMELDLEEILSPEDCAYKTETPEDNEDLQAFVHAVGDLGENVDESLSFDRMLEKEFEDRKTPKRIQDILQGARP